MIYQDCPYLIKFHSAFLPFSVGVHNRNQQESTAVEHRVRRVIVHSGWNPNTFDNDIALLELASPIQFNKYVSPVCLPKADPPVGSQCYITGTLSVLSHSCVVF